MCYNEGPANERTPLRPRTEGPLGTTAENADTFVCSPSLWFIAVIFTFGAAIGGYLLIMQGEDYPISKPFFLVRRSQWGADPMAPTGPAFPHTNNLLSLVIVTQFPGHSCGDIESCSDLLRHLETCNKTVDVPYNFLVGPDGNTYEGQGWRNQSLLPLPDRIHRNASLVLAFIGDFTVTAPGRDQIEEAQAWIEESKSRGHLRADYSLIGVRNLTRDNNDGQRLYEEIQQWPHYNTTLNEFFFNAECKKNGSPGGGPNDRFWPLFFFCTSLSLVIFSSSRGIIN